MNMDGTETTKCTRNCWLIALAVGLIVAYFLLNLLGLNFYLALFLGSVVFALGGKYLVNRFCVDVADQGSDATGPSPEPTPAPKPESAPEPQVTPAPDPTPEPQAAPQAPAAPAGDDVLPSVVKPSTALPGQAELAARKGSWRYHGGAD